jgi:undecaprenyl-diphosphatase
LEGTHFLNMIDTLIHADKQAMLWLNSRHSPFFDQVMWFVSGRPEWIPLYLALLGWVIWRYRKHSVWIILTLVVMIVLSDQLANLLKNGVQRLRPCRDPEIGPLVHVVRNRCGGAFGFVSGHAANSFALTVFISLLFRKSWLTVSMLCWAVLISYSRIYLGVHYPGDVLGGAVLGTAVAMILFGMLRFSLPSGRLRQYEAGGEIGGRGGQKAPPRYSERQSR